MFVEHIINILNNCLLDLKKEGLSIQFEIDKSLLEKPQKSIHGDYACTIAMKFAHKLNLKTIDFANNIVPLKDVIISLAIERPNPVCLSLLVSLSV